MKYIKPLFLVVLISFVLIISCNKNNSKISTDNNKPTLSLSKTTVKIGEPLIVSTEGQTTGSVVKWSTASNGQVWTSTSSDSATILFTIPGNYQITATYYANVNDTSSAMGYDSSNASVSVSDSVYGDTSTVHCDAIVVKNLSAGDQINLTPISFSDTGLIFLAHTQMLYPNSPLLDCGGNIPLSGDTFECDFNSTLEYACFGSPSPTPATGIVSFTHVSTGTYNLVFKLSGVSYQGSLAVTDTNCTISWTNSSGVTISPLTIQKQ